MEIYCQKPLYFQENIPVFSNSNGYTENYEKIAFVQLSKIRETGQNPWISEELWLDMEESTANSIKKYSKPGDRILDVGVGLGRLLSRFPDLQRYGLDISIDLLKESQSKGINVCYSLLEDIPYSKEIFDIIICTDILEHVLNLNLCCEKMISTLKPGGYLIIRTPFKENLDSCLDPNCPFKYVHLRNFDTASFYLLFSRIIEDCQVIETTFSGDFEDYMRLKKCLPFPKGVFLLRIYLKILKKLFPTKYKSLLRHFFEPLEINVVIQKKKMTNEG